MIQTEPELDDLLTQPTSALVDAIRQFQSPLVVLGASGKMGPSLCVLARRAAEAARHPLKIIAASRFSDFRSRQWLEDRGIATIACDFLERQNLAQLPDCANLIYLVGMKFGTQQNPSLTWAVNTLVPAHTVERYPTSRTVALSTGNVYPFVSAKTKGASEDQPTAPIGEYASAALARERLFEYGSRLRGTPVVLLRLNYAVELRYGVLLDIAQRVWRNDPVDMANGYLNCIWQGDANELILRSLPLASNPPAVLNMTGPEVLSVRTLALRFGELLGRSVTLRGAESDNALLNDASRLCARLGQPPTPIAKVMEWIAHWLRQGGGTLGKPTHFEERTGQF